MNIPCGTRVTILYGLLRYDGQHIVLTHILRSGPYIVVEDLGLKVTLLPANGGPLVTTWKYDRL